MSDRIKKPEKANSFILIICICFTVHLNAQQIPNSGFEYWTNLQPDDWETNSCPYCNPPYETYVVRQDSDACEGTFSAKFINNNVYSSWAESKIETTIHPLNLFACVKSDIQIGDSVIIDVFIYYNGEVVDEGHWLNKSTILNYSNIKIPISQNSISVDSIKIKVSGGTQINTILFADNLSFTVTNELQENINDLSWTLNPNPFNDCTWLIFNNLTNEKLVMKIYNSNGQLVKTISSIYTDRVRIEKDNLTNGVYFFKLYNSKMIIATGKLMIK